MKKIMRAYLGRNRQAESLTPFPVGMQEWLIFLKMVSEQIDAFTWYEAHGVWRGVAEDTFILEVILASPADVAKLKSLAAAYRQLFEQESVLFTCHEIEAEIL